MFYKDKKSYKLFYKDRNYYCFNHTIATITTLKIGIYTRVSDKENQARSTSILFLVTIFYSIVSDILWFHSVKLENNSLKLIIIRKHI